MQFHEWQAQQQRNRAHFHAPRHDMREEIMLSDKPVDPELANVKDWDQIVNLLDRRA